MDAILLGQYLVVALAVFASAVYVLRRQFPAATRHLRIALAISLLRDGRPAWLRWLGQRITPSARKAIACNGCTTCSGRGNSTPMHS